MIESQHPNDCIKCELCKSRTQVVHSILIENSRVMFINESPGITEDEKGIPLIGQASKILTDIMMELGINRNEISVGNMVACRPQDNRAPFPKEVDACFEFLDQEIKLVNPELLVLLGNTPLKKLIEGVGGITKVRGKWFESKEYNCKVLPTFHPAYILRNPQERGKLVSDLQMVKNFIEGTVFENITKPTNYLIIRNQNQFDWLINNLNKEELWAFDTETSGLDFQKDEIFIFTFSWKEYTSVLIDLRLVNFDKNYLWSKLKEVFENNSKKVTQNGSFDIEFLMMKNININNYYCDSIFQHYLIDENSKHDLGALASLYTDKGGYEIELEQYKMQNKIESYTEIPIEIIHPYANSDTDVTLRSYNAMLPKIYEEGLDFVLFNIMMPTQRILIETEVSGVSIDRDHLEKTIIKYTQKMEEQLRVVYSTPEVKSYIKDKQDEIIKELEEKWKSSKNLTKRFPEFNDYIASRKEKDTKFEFNIKSPNHLKELLLDRMKLPILEKTKKGSPCVKEEVLLEYAKKNKFCENLSKYRSLSHIKSTFLEGIKEEIDSEGKVHTDYRLFSTVTGRPSSRNPNLSNIPRTGTAEDIKDIFCADIHEDGSRDWLVEADFGQAEFRTFIHYSSDPQALKDLKVGIDVHKLIAANAYLSLPLPKGDITYEQFKELTKDVTKEQRQNTKLIIFGILYGRGAKSVAEQLNISVQLAQRIINTFFDRYRVAKKWLDITIAEARRDGYVTSLFGRKRRLLNIKHSNEGLRAEAERQSINSRVQSAASDLTFLALIEIYKVIKERNLKSRLVLTVYDSVIFNCPDEEVEFVSRLVFEKMQEPPFEEIIVPLIADIKIGKNWGSLMEVDMKEDWNTIQNKLDEKFLTKGE